MARVREMYRRTEDIAVDIRGALYLALQELQVFKLKTKK